uniref:BTB domain-containing protein n=1 Tax=Panagrolaimus sp. PS1159 TaxID=55785 RepID=A0AC35FFL7_9BILA
MNQEESVKDNSHFFNGLKKCELSNEVAKNVDGDRRFGADISNLPAKRNRTRTYKFFDGTTHNNIRFEDNLEKPSKKRNITFENDDMKDAVPKKRGRKSNEEIKNLKENENERGISGRTRTEKPSHSSASKQRSRTKKPGVKETRTRTTQNQRTRAVIKAVTTTTPKLLQQTHGETATTTTPKLLQQTHGETGEHVDSERNTPAPSTRTEKAFDPMTSTLIQRSRTEKPAIKTTQTRTSKMQRIRTEKPMKNRAEAIPKQPERTRGGSRKSIEIVCDRKIEGQCRIFDVNTTMLSQRSATFKQLFEVNMNETILIEAVPDRTLEMAIDFCHGKSLTECSNSDMSSLLFFADTWEIVDLKLYIKVLSTAILEAYRRTNDSTNDT